jgi:pectin methylesterase-like acyl-CoA thioesterase
MDMGSCAKHIWRGGFVAALFTLCVVQASSAVNMTVVSRQPANGATGICPDTRLWITWGSLSTSVSTGGYLRIYRASDNYLVYQLNLQTLSNPPAAAGWPYQIVLGEKSVNYQPFSTAGNVLDIQPSVRLEYNTTYYVKMSQGFSTDGSGRTSPAIADTTTWRFTTRAAAPAVDGEYVVAGDGSGDFCTIQGAIDAVPDNSSTRTIIKVRKGTYREIVNIPSSKKKITLLGEDRDTTAVAAFNNNTMNDAGSGYRCMIENNADDLRIYNMTFRNTTPQGGSQAEALKSGGSDPSSSPKRCLARNCRFYSYQDTLLITGTMYFGDCYIEGDVDYMWGYGSAFFERCELRSMRTGGYNLMPRNGNGVPGYIFLNCTLTAPSGITGVYLARDAGLSNGVPYFPYGQVVYIECKMGSHIHLIGWKITDGYDRNQLFLGEYHSMDLSGSLLNVSARDYRSRQLTDSEAVYWRNVTNVLGGWDPNALSDLPTAAWQPVPADGAANVDAGGVTLKWSAGATTTSHLVYFGTDNPPAFLGEQTAASRATGPLTVGATYYWRIDEKNSVGTTTGTVWSLTAVSDGLPPSPSPMTWYTVPHATGPYSVEMTATTATDLNGVEYYFLNYTDPTHDSGWQDSPIYADSGLQAATAYAYAVVARDKSPLQNATAVSSAITINTNNPPDLTPPSPDPMTWVNAPYGMDSYSIAMTATTAADASAVEYYFACTAGGGHDSGWQNSPTYIDGSLFEGQTCTYTVQARDKSPARNITAASAPATATTVGVPPTPSPMSFAVAPRPTSYDSITMTAADASDPSGVEYFFANMTETSHISGWQDGAAWTDTGLTNGTTYTYRVIARDKSPLQNETAWSDPNWATTPRFLCGTPIASDADADCESDFRDFAIVADAWSQTPPTVQHAVNGTFTDDIIPGWQQLDLPTATGTFASAYDNSMGNPPGVAFLFCDTEPEGTAGHYFYQVMPVTVGRQYTFSAEWTGDMTEAGLDPANRTQWSRVLVSFESSTDPAAWTSLGSPDSIMYGKSFGATNQNIGTTGMWDWEQITASPIHGPVDGVFTATGRYMVVAFTVGGHPSSGVGLYILDNVSVTGPACPQFDLNGDCSLDFADVCQLASDWLTCNRAPSGECWAG